MPSAMKSAWATSASASFRRPAPRARATAEATPPPIPPADMVIISITRGKTSETPASASPPSQPTKTASSVLTRAWSTMTATLGAASRRRVGATAPSRRRRVRAAIGGAEGAGRAIDPAVAPMALPPHCLFAEQGHARARGARDQALALVRDVALGEADGASGLDDAARRREPPRAHRLQEVDLELERRERLPLVEAGRIGDAHRRVRDVAQD